MSRVDTQTQPHIPSRPRLIARDADVVAPWATDKKSEIDTTPLLILLILRPPPICGVLFSNKFHIPAPLLN